VSQFGSLHRASVGDCVDIAAQMISTMANLEGEETFEASFLGQADEVVQERICDDELILIKGYERFKLTDFYILTFILLVLDFYCAHFHDAHYWFLLNASVTVTCRYTFCK